MRSNKTREGAPVSRPSWRRRVLVVEDSPDLWKLIETFSRRLDPGLVIDFCDGPDEAEKRLKQGEPYDVLISDYCLPKPGDGEILRTRIQRSHPDTSFGMISGLLGFKPKDVPYLRKPFTQNDFRGFLNDLLP